MKHYFNKAYKPKIDAVLKNNFNNETVVGDILNEEEIDGRLFYVVKVGPRTMKLAKDGYKLLRSRNS